MNRKTKDGVVEEIRAVAQSLGVESLSQTQFFSNSNVTISDVLRHFPKWSDACLAAGVGYDRSRDKLSDEDLLSDWGQVARKLGKIPTLTEYKVHGNHSRNPFNRFGKWFDVPQAFTVHFADSDEWLDVLELVQTALPRKPKLKPRSVAESQANNTSAGSRRYPRLDGGPTFGDPIDFRGLRHAPVNEQGVVFLFGIVARELGFSVEAIQSGFPDCQAKCRVSRGKWKSVRIEFEFESRNFVDHRHDPYDCEVIVCWSHNWQDCPEHLEVIELSKVIEKLPEI